MSEYLIVAETVIYKNDKLTCINTYDNFRAVAMPSEFVFDMAILCGPKWTVGEHKVSVKAKANDNREFEVGSANVNISNEDFVCNVLLQNVKVTMDYSVSDLTFYIYDNDNEVYSRKYQVNSILVPQDNEGSGQNNPQNV